MRAPLAALSLLAVLVTGCGGSGGTSTAQRRGATTGESLRALVPNSIAFWDARHGLIGTGYRSSSDCSGTVSLTADGGRSFRVALRTPGPVEWVETAGARDAWALVERCRRVRGRAVSSRLLRSSDGGRTWQRLPHSRARNPSFATPRRGLAVASAGAANGPALLQTSDGGRSWHPVSNPCPRAVDAAVTSPAPAEAWLVCVGQPGVGNQAKEILTSTDGGRSWHPLVKVGILSSAAGLSHYGYPGGLTFSRAGSGLLWESRGSLYLTPDGGRHWRPLSVARPEVDFGDSAVMLSPRRGFVLLSARSVRLLATRDGGRSWAVVDRWPAP